MGRGPNSEHSAQPLSKDLRIKFGENLRRARERIGLTQAAFAGKLGVRPPQVNRIEKGQENLTLETMSRVAEAVGLTASDLLGLCDGKPN